LTRDIKDLVSSGIELGEGESGLTHKGFKSCIFSTSLCQSIVGGDVRYKGIAYTFLNGAKQCQIKKYHEKTG